MVHSWFHDVSGLFGGIFIVLSLCAASESVPTSEKCSSTNVFSSKSVLVNGEFAIMSKTAGPDLARSALRNVRSQHFAVCSTMLIHGRHLDLSSP